MVEVMEEVETQNSEMRPYNGTSNQIKIPCTVNGVKVVGILDTGATVSVLHKDFVQANGWTLEKRTGSVIHAFQGEKTARIDVVPQAEIRAGKYTAHSNIEVANLSNNIFFLIEMDLIGKIGIKVGNLPFVWPNSPNIQRSVPLKKQEEPAQLPPEIGHDGIADEWRDVINDNLQLPVSGVCTLSDSTLSIETGDNKPSWIRQYPIPQALMDKAKTRVNEWITNGWVVSAPKNCQWNSPLLVAPKPAKKKGDPDDICFCLDA